MKGLPAAFLAVSLVVPTCPILPLTGCTSTLNSSGTLTAANIMEAQTIVLGLTKVYSDVKVDLPALIPAGTPSDNEIMAALGAATSAVSGISSLASAGDNAVALKNVAAAVTDVLNVLAATLPGSGVPPAVMLGLQATQLLVPDLITLAQSLPPAAVAPVAAMPSAAMMTLPVRFKNPALTKDAAMSALRIAQ
jgi:hypothetical protein